MHEFFHEWLVSLREKKGLSGNELALRAGIDQSTYSKVERGKRDPSDEMLKAIAPHLGVEFAELKLMLEAELLYKESPEAADKALQTLIKRIESGRKVTFNLDANDSSVNLQSLPGGLSNVKYPPNAEEQSIIDEAIRWDALTLELSYPDTWEMPPEKRRALFQGIQEEIANKKARQERKRAQ